MTTLLDRVRAGLKLPAGPGHARVVQALPLGPGTRLLVVEFGGRQVLVGQGRGGLVALAEGPEARAEGPGALAQGDPA